MISEEEIRLKKDLDMLEEQTYLLRLKLMNLERRAIEAVNDKEYLETVNKIIATRKEINNAAMSEMVIRYRWAQSGFMK